MKSKTGKRHYRTKRIYYGPEGHETEIWWTVRVSDAKQQVIVDGDVLHALRAHPGVTVGCGLSKVVEDKRNRKAFPHPVYLASFTKSTALIVDDLKKDGSPRHAFQYQHRYGHITDRNDDGTLKKMVTEDPTIMQRAFTLNTPRKRSAASLKRGRNGGKTSHDRSASDKTKSFIPRGALARAVKAGRIGKNVAEQITAIASE